jgi:hypothetical protein
MIDILNLTREMVTQQELFLSQLLQLAAITRLLIKKGIFTEAEFFQELKLAQTEEKCSKLKGSK